MNGPDLTHLAPGFDDEAFGSQAVFRAAMDALSHPGRPLDMPVETGVPRQGHIASAALLLGLLDADTSVWISPSLRHSDAASWLRFHTGCQCLDDVGAAQFVWLALGDELPQLSELRLGNDTYPHQSATCVIEVRGLQADAPGWTLRGPGIPGERSLSIQGLPMAFEALWADNHAKFPCGVDVFLTTPTQLAGLPRTTRMLSLSEG